MLISLSEAAEFLKNCSDAVIITHQSPDGDCIGAGFALKDILEAIGKRSRVVCADEFPKRFDFLTSAGCGEEFEPETIITVDIADVQLMGKLRELYGDKVQLCIDHHVSNTGYAQRTLLDPHASAACELIYELSQEMGVELNEHAAACIYTGIATDTGCFKFDCTTVRCHEIAAELMRSFDINFSKINRNMFDVKSIGRIKLESAVLELMEYYWDSRLTMICATADIMEKMGVDTDDLDGCANLPLQVENAEVGILIKEREPGVYKISMRSANDINVSEICQTLGGGGHAKAAGCLLRGSLDDVKKRLAEAVGKALE
ncbi:MAG: bifunctional oligoribonuclease/PAP phosphatase NrnA [Ruminococcus sp.]|nr:bifunctional oligoribonuclease/PAP phosphatase NrnA [Ruminococcus sp.]